MLVYQRVSTLSSSMNVDPPSRSEGFFFSGSEGQHGVPQLHSSVGTSVMPLLAAPQIVSFLGMMIKPRSSFLLGNYAMFKELPGCLTGAKQLKLLSLEDSAGSGIGHWISHETSNMLGKFEIEHGEFLYFFFFMFMFSHRMRTDWIWSQPALHRLDKAK